MPQYINRPKTTWDPTTLSILNQQANRTLQQREAERLERQKNLAMMVDQYGGLEATLMANPGVATEYMMNSGFSNEQIQNALGRVNGGAISAQQELLGLSQLAAQNRYEMGREQPAPVSVPPVPPPAPEDKEGVYKPSTATLEMLPDEPGTDVSPTNGSTSAPLGDQILDSISKGMLSTLSDSQQALVRSKVTIPEIQNLLNDYRNGKISDVGQAALTLAQQRTTVPSSAGEGKVADETDLMNQHLKQISQTYEGKTYSEIETDVLGKRSAGYRRGTYKGDLAKELYWNSLSDGEKKKLVSDGKDVAVGNFDPTTLTGAQKAAYDSIAQYTTQLQEEQTQATEAARKFRDSMGYKTGASSAGDKMRTAQVVKQTEMYFGDPQVQKMSWGALGENVPKTIQGLQYYERMRQNSPELWARLMPREIATDLQRAELEGKEITNKTNKLILKKMEAIVTPEYLEALGETELVSLGLNAALLAAQVAAARGAGMGGVDWTERLSSLTNLLNTKGSSKELTETANNMLLKILEEMSTEMTDFNVVLENYLRPWKGGLKATTTLGGQDVQTSTSAAADAFTIE